MKNMIKTTIKNALIGAVSMLAAAGATASTVSVNPATISVQPNEVFNATIRADFTDVGGFTAGGFLLTWDPNLLSLVSSTPNPAIVDLLIGPPNITAGSVDYGFATCLFVCGPTDVLGASDTNFLLFSLEFQVDANAPDGPTPADLSLGILGDAWVGPDGFADVTPPPENFNGATITVQAVPVPAAVWLFGSGLLGLVGVARRSRVAS